MTGNADASERGKRPTFDIQAFIGKYDHAKTENFQEGQVIYAQGDPTDAIYYIIGGTVKISIISEQGKEGVVAMLGPGDFFGEGCLSYRRTRATTVTAASACEIVRLEKAAAVRAFKEEPAFCTLLTEFLLDRNEKLKDDLLDQLFNSSEKRLARLLLTLAHTGVGDQSSTIAIPVTQETLANMVGTTRSRISQFMTKFRKLGYIDYNGQIRVYNSLVNIILHDQPHGGGR